ncbi:hypothetical protein KDW49_17130 [Burkholderia dolosa]|uniref:alpha-L-arabinofuranosidase C-terminal domain-containing protein n=1 Tax=Burkholderia dolosa TaxID=152500 RepID=UPI001BA31A7A|nr:alpha-L-arabinofuranosidase C-terminal domain-containing protein [Burkholderia dolosa]MBR8302432.1 hypothetical protein [Burkholderia dolosa]
MIKSMGEPVAGSIGGKYNIEEKKAMHVRRTTLAALVGLLGCVGASAQTVVTFNAAAQTGTVHRGVFGANHRYGVYGSGSADPTTGITYPTLVSQIGDAGITMLRFPGGTMANTYHWYNAIGPQSQRKTQVNGNVNAAVPLDSTFGPDEFGNLLDRTGAVGNLMVNFATESAADAAHFVAYMTAPQGAGVVDGVDWAAMHAANGHVAPYNIAYVEVGNEMSLGNQTYWMTGTPVTINAACSSNKVPCLYAFGGTTSFTKQPVVAPDNWQSSASVSTGAPNQSFYVSYKPAVPGSQTIYVGSTAWTPVASLSSAGPTDQVYTFNPATGQITFGDGAKGAIPPSGSKITATYQSGPHDGFTAYYAAIKAVNPSVKVCASTAAPNVLGTANPFDCVVMHQYAPTLSSPTDIDEYFGERMLQVSALGGQVQSMRQTINSVLGTTQGPKVDILISEYGIQDPQPSYAPNFLRSMGAAIFEGLTLQAWMNHDIRAAERHALTDYTFGTPPVNTGVSLPDNVLFGGPGPQTIATPAALAMKMFTHFSGTTLVSSSTTNNPVRTLTSGQTLKALVPIASVDASGNGYLIVVNQDPETPVTATVQPQNLPHGASATVETLASTSITSDNTPSAPYTVQLADQVANVGTSTFQWTFPAHSITAFRFTPQ